MADPFGFKVDTSLYSTDTSRSSTASFLEEDREADITSEGSEQDSLSSTETSLSSTASCLLEEDQEPDISSEGFEQEADITSESFKQADITSEGYEQELSMQGTSGSTTESNGDSSSHTSPNIEGSGSKDVSLLIIEEHDSVELGVKLKPADSENDYGQEEAEEPVSLEPEADIQSAVASNAPLEKGKSHVEALVDRTEVKSEMANEVNTSTEEGVENVLSKLELDKEEKEPSMEVDEDVVVLSEHNNNEPPAEAPTDSLEVKSEMANAVNTSTEEGVENVLAKSGTDQEETVTSVETDEDVIVTSDHDNESSMEAPEECAEVKSEANDKESDLPMEVSKEDNVLVQLDTDNTIKDETDIEHNKDHNITKDEEEGDKKVDPATQAPLDTSIEDYDLLLKESTEDATVLKEQLAEETTEKHPSPSVSETKIEELVEVSPCTDVVGVLPTGDTTTEAGSVQQEVEDELEPVPVAIQADDVAKADHFDAHNTRAAKEDTTGEDPLVQEGNEVAYSGVDNEDTDEAAPPKTTTPESQSARDIVKSYTTFKRIVPAGPDHDATKSIATARDLPQLENVSVDTSNDSRVSRPDDTQWKATLRASNENEVMVEALAPRAPHPAVSLTDNACTDSGCLSSSSDGSFISSSGDSFSFQAKREPDGDCDFLDQTLNVSAIDTSTDQSSIAADLSSQLVETEIAKQVKDPSLMNHEQEEDAPGDIMVNQSKTTSDDSLVLLKIPEDSQPSESGDIEITTPGTIEIQLPNCDGIVAQLDPLDTSREELKVNISVESRSTFVSAEEGSEGIELIATPLTVNPNESRPLDERAVKSSSSTDQLNQDPLLARLSAEGPSKAKQSLFELSESRGKLNDDDTPIARMRNNALDPDGVVTDRQRDSTLLGGLRNESSSLLDERDRPKVSFAAMHKDPRHDRLAYSPAPHLVHGDLPEIEASEVRPLVSIDEVRRTRFAEYLKRRMIDYEDDAEEEEGECEMPVEQNNYQLARRQEGIPRLLDPNMCASVESSFTTMMSKGDTADDASTIYSAIDVYRKAKKSRKYEEDSDSESSSCSDSEYSYEEEDVGNGRSKNTFPSFFTETAKARDNQDDATLDPVPKWCDNMVLPSVSKLEDFLGELMTDNKKQVTQAPLHSEQEALSDFVDELENEEPLDDIDSLREHDAPMSTVSDPKAIAESKPTEQPVVDGDISTPISRQIPEQWGFLTMADIHELALMAAAAIEGRSTNLEHTQRSSLEPKQSSSLWTRSTSPLNESSYSTEAAWDNVEHTVNDLESVTGQRVKTKSKTHSRITAKLEHIKKTQPHVYKVFLAKMAAAERSGRKIDDKRDDAVPRSSHVKANDLISPGKIDLITKSPDVTDDEISCHLSDDISVQSPNGAVKIKVESVSTKKKGMSAGATDWEPFDGSPFKGPTAQPLLAGDFVADLNDDSSVFDDFKWLSSAKDSFASTIESFMDSQNEMARPLRERLAQYSKTHPNFYRDLMKKAYERERRVSSPQARRDGGVSSDGIATETPDTNKKGTNKLVTNDPLPLVRKQVTQIGDAARVTKVKNTDASSSKFTPDSTGVISTISTDLSSLSPSTTTTTLAENQEPVWQPNGDNDSQMMRTLRRRGSAAKSQCGNRALGVTKGTVVDVEESCKTDVAKKIDFFARKNESMSEASVRAVQKSSVASMHELSDMELHWRVNKSLQPMQGSVAQRSQTPLSSNRSGSPGSFNHLQTTLSAFEALQTASSVHLTTMQGESEEPTTAKDCTFKKNLPVKQPSTEAKIQDSTTPPAGSKWETFEASSFKGSGVRTVPGNGQDGLPRINLEATFLDSLLPAPPKFPAQPAAHHQERESWDFSRAEEQLGEQWEQFSPTSFPTNFTNWGLKERPTRVSTPSGRKPRVGERTRSSPSSIAEF